MDKERFFLNEHKKRTLSQNVYIHGDWTIFSK